MSTYQFVPTSKLEVAYLEWNAAGAKTALLLHGWPDSPACWKGVAPLLAEAGYRVIAPALRGFAPTRFKDATTPRTGQLASLGRDLLEFIDALKLEQPVLVGHDWGARAAANACGLREGVASAMVMVSVGYGTNQPDQPLSLPQARNFWYHWFMATPHGERAVREQGEAFARQMWDTWAPAGWYTPQAFEEAAEAFKGDGWAEVTLHSYTHRWGLAPADSAYDADEAALTPPPVLSVPTLMIHGGADGVTLPESSAGKERFFRGRYERIVLDGIGHFPPREAPQAVAEAVLAFMRKL